MEDKVAELIAYYEKYASERGIRLNPNRKVVEGIVRALVEKEESFGYPYCPCRVMSGDEDKDTQIVCPCVFHLKEIEQDGRCKCNLFVSADE